MTPTIPDTAQRSVALPRLTPFIQMTRHGEGAREPLRRGCVVLSRLEGGRSAIRALAPSVKYVLAGEELYRIDGRTRRCPCRASWKEARSTRWRGCSAAMRGCWRRGPRPATGSHAG